MIEFDIAAASCGWSCPTTRSPPAWPTGRPPRRATPSGVFAKYAALVSSASEGAVTRPAAASVNVLVLADTHVPGHARALPAALDRHLRWADLILHAGDVTDARAGPAGRTRAGARVAGNIDRPDVPARGIAERLRLELQGVPVAMVHDAGARAGPRAAAAFVVSGAAGGRVRPFASTPSASCWTACCCSIRAAPPGSGGRHCRRWPGWCSVRRRSRGAGRAVASRHEAVGGLLADWSRCAGGLVPAPAAVRPRARRPASTSSASGRRCRRRSARRWWRTHRHACCRRGWARSGAELVVGRCRRRAGAGARPLRPLRRAEPAAARRLAAVEPQRPAVRPAVGAAEHRPDRERRRPARPATTSARWPPGSTAPAAPRWSWPTSTPGSTPPIPTWRRTSGSTRARTAPAAAATASTTTATATSTTGGAGTSSRTTTSPTTPPSTAPTRPAPSAPPVTTASA